MGLSNKKYRMARMDEQELKVIARDLVTGKAWMAQTPEEFGLAFGFLLSAAFNMKHSWVTEKWVRQIGTAVGYMKDAMPVATNGIPMFMSCRFIHHRDEGTLWKWIGHYNEVLAT